MSLQNASVTPAIDSGVCAPLISSAFTGGSESLISERRPAHALAIMATETDNRMFVQQGCFTVHDPEAGRIDEQPDADFFLTKWSRSIVRQGFRPLGVGRGLLYRFGVVPGVGVGR